MSRLMFKLLSIAAFAFSLSACGGGGGGGSSSGNDSTAGSAGGDNTINLAPTAIAGDDQIVTEQSLVILDASNSVDPESEPLEYMWRQIQGETAALSSNSDEKPSFIAPSQTGILTYELTVTDSQNNSAVDAVNIVVVQDDNRVPTAEAGLDRSVYTNSVVTLNGAQSSDDDGDALTYLWSQQTGTPVLLSSASSISPSFNAPGIADTLSFSLIVSDGKSLSEPDLVTVHVAARPVNQAPLADAGADLNVAAGSEVRLSGLNSSDADGDSLTYRWAQIGGNRVPLNYSTSAQASFRAPLADGVYSFSLVVNDGRLDSEPDTVTVNVFTEPPEPENTVPIANAGADQRVFSRELVSMDGRSSSDDDNDVLSYAWVQISGSPSVAINDASSSVASFTAPPLLDVSTPEDLVFELRVHDGQVYSAADSVVITVEGRNEAPVADAGGDQNVLAGSVVTLDGSASYDPEGEALSYVWTPTNGTVLSLDNSTIVRPSFTAPAEPGALYFDLVVSDGESQSSASRVVINVNGVNNPPVANAGENISSIGNRQISLDGSASNDPEGDDLSFRWQQVAGTDVVLDSDSVASPSFIAPNTNEELRFSLVVNDGEFDSSTDFVSVTLAAENQLPIARAGDDLTIEGGELVVVDGSMSSDPEGQALSYSWRQVSGQYVLALGDTTSQQLSITLPDEGGTYVLGLTVNDGQDDSLEDLIQLLVTSRNNLPIADAGDDLSVAGGTSVSLDGSASSDADGDELSFTWQQVEGPSVSLTNSSTAAPSFSAPEAGATLRFQLLVNDGVSTSLPDEVSITVSPLNHAPLANAGDNQTVDGGELVILDASASSDVDGDALSFAWTVLNNANITLSATDVVQPQFVAPEAGGDFEFSLVVSDGELFSSEDRVLISVNALNQAPVANAGEDHSVGGNEVVQLSAINSADPDGDALSYLWTQVSGTNVSLSSNTAESVTFTTPNLDEVLVFELVVNDGVIDSIADTVSVSITAYNERPVAVAGDDQTVNGDELVTLDGTGSVDPENSALTFSWSQLSGPVSVSLDTSNPASPTFSAPPLGGVFEFELIVNDGELDSLADTVTINVNEINLLPIADAGSDQTVDGLSTVTLDASLSSDPNSDEITYSWTQTGGTPVSLDSFTEVAPTFIAPNVDDVINLELIVNDGELSSLVDTVTITINRVNEQPIAHAGSGQFVIGNELVTLDASLSADPEGADLTYTWLQVSGESVVLSDDTVVNPSFTSPNEIGVLEFSLIVNDGLVDSEPAAVTVEVTPINSAPVANAGADRFVSTGSIVTLLGNRSYDVDDDPLTYVWTQISGPAVTLDSNSSAAPTFTAAVDGTMEFSLIANDGELDSAPDTIVVTAGVIPVTNTKINDTGIIWGAEAETGNNETCVGETITMQDCYQGRDFTHNDDTDGRAGFSYTKISEEGVEIAADSSEWNCVKDNVTGLVWEVKQGGNDIRGDEGLHDADDLFNWYEPDAALNGGNEGFANDDGAICALYDENDETTFCNSKAFVDRVNDAGYCGYSDWRMPTRKELLSLVDYGQGIPAIDVEYFRSGGSSVWSSTPFSLESGTPAAWSVSYTGAKSFSLGKSNVQRVRLVRSVE